MSNKVFTREGLLAFLKRRSGAYKQTFSSPTGQIVLADLAEFCRAFASTWDADPAKRDVLIGRREVFLRIMDHMNLTSEQYAQLYAAIPNPTQDE